MFEIEFETLLADFPTIETPLLEKNALILFNTESMEILFFFTNLQSSSFSDPISRAIWLPLSTICRAAICSAKASGISLVSILLISIQFPPILIVAILKYHPVCRFIIFFNSSSLYPTHQTTMRPFSSLIHRSMPFIARCFDTFIIFAPFFI